MMVTIREAEQMLDEVAESLPEEIFRHLNGGVSLSPLSKLSPHAVDNDLYILGEYFSGGVLGRYIVIYYGSFARTFGNIPPDMFKQELARTLKHELTHHLESLAGEKDLEIEDAEQLWDYLSGKGD